MENILDTLNEITGTGRFCSTGNHPFFFPDISIDGEELGFPLSGAQVRELIAQAECAPHGRGEATVLDERVRKSWQIDASALSIQSGAWKKMLDKLLKTISADLGIKGAVDAQLYKLLIYGKGGHFQPHRDTEKLDAMFGTLIIKLPSKHEGGQLHIRHGGESVSVDFSAPELLHDFQYAALFADCEHEVEPVTSGHRVCLVYNLVLKKGDPAELNRTVATHAAKLRPHFKNLSLDAAQWPCAIMLEHQYTKANFSLNGLKNHDQARARALCAAADAAGFDTYIALVTLHQQGELDGVDYGYSRRSRYWEDEDDDDWSNATIGEIYEESLSISHWLNGMGKPVALKEFQINESLLLGHADLEAFDPIEKEGEGPTGNAGCTMDYWYRRAAVVLWPRSEREQVLAKYDLDGAVDAFRDLASAKKTDKPSEDLLRFGAAIIQRIQDNAPGYPHDDAPTQARFLEGIALAKSHALFKSFQERVPVSEFRGCRVKEWKCLLKNFDKAAFDLLFQQLEPECGANLAASMFAALQACMEIDATHPLATRFLKLATTCEFPAERPRWGEPKRSHASQIHSLIAASHLTKGSQRKELRKKILGNESLDHLRIHLAPALLLKTHVRRHFDRSESLYAELLEWAQATLQTEVADTIQPFPDWTRPSTEGMAKRCPQIDAFLKDPNQKEFVLPALKSVRESLASHIRSEGVDLDCKMLRQGSPHKLVCTKNQNSLKQGRKRRAEDQTLLEKLSQN